MSSEEVVQQSQPAAEGETSGRPSNQQNNKRIIEMLTQLYFYVSPRGDKTVQRRLGLSMASLVLARICSATMPLFYGMAVDMVNLEDGFIMTALLFVLGGYALTRLGEQVFSELKQFFFTRVAQRAVRGAALATFGHLHGLSMRFHLDRQTGGLSRAVERGAKAVEYLLMIGALELLPILLELAFVSGLLWWLFGFEYAAVTFITVSLYAFFTIRVTEWRMAFRRAMNQADEKAATRAVDSLLNFETVKYFNAEEAEMRRYDSALQRYETAAVRSRTSLAAVNIGQGAIIATGLLLVMIMAARDIQSGAMSVGDFVVVNTYLLQLYIPLNFLGWIYREMRQSIVDLERMLGLLDEYPDVSDETDAPALKLNGGAIRFENVHFTYQDRKILKGVSFEVEAGKRVAIVGPSGAGKSTISRLLFRFYDPQNGRILIDDQDISQVTQHSVRAAIGVVPQDTVMFNASIGYNIGYARDGASQAEIEEAARLASIDGFIAQLPQGYDTVVGERGLKLSGGEKQRVAIARTILKAPSVFLFDEATSALDSRTEKDIQEALNKVSAQQTTLVIAHRLSTIIDADEILVLQDGLLVERGTHLELLDQQGLYATMWERQSSGFQETSKPNGTEVSGLEPS
ncbi:MAG: ABCB family ABC transporter ATP-binding protein/permease [Candidatus Puniceispirillaceae bacterium]